MTPLNSPINSGPSLCERVSAYTVDAGIATSLAGTIASAAYYNSVWLAALVAISGMGCVASRHIFKLYRKLKPLEALSAQVGNTAQRVEKAAASVDLISDHENELVISIRETNEKMEAELVNLRSENQISADRIKRMAEVINSLNSFSRDLAVNNGDLKKQVDQLKSDMEYLSEHIERFKMQNRDFYTSIEAMGLQLVRFEEDEKELQVVSTQIDKTVVGLTKTLRNAQENSTAIFKELKKQNEDLKAKIDEFTATVERLEKVDKQLTPKLEERRRLERRIAHASSNLESLHAQVKSEASELRAIRISRKNSNPSASSLVNTAAHTPPPYLDSPLSGGYDSDRTERLKRAEKAAAVLREAL